jgi:hypothetical protein
VARRGAGLSGAALFVGVGGLYLAYAGIRDVPLVEGLRSLLRGKRPSESRRAYNPITLDAIARSEGDLPNPQGGAGDQGITRLVGSARLGYVMLKAAFPTLRFSGWRPQGSVPGSRHPLGLAIDITPLNAPQDDRRARTVIAAFKLTSGARCWIWNRQIGCAPDWRARPYSGPSPHTDHVHVDWVS